MSFRDDESDNSVHNFVLDEHEVYKFVEVVAPEGYLQPNWEKGGLTTNKDFVFCYAYAGVEKDGYPNEVKNSMKTWTKESRLNIPNSSRITIKAQKQFSGTEPPNTSSVELALYYSTNRSGKNKKLVDTEFLALKENELATYKEKHDNTEFALQNPITLDYNVTDSSQLVDTVEWEMLPSGMDGETIYYFVVEDSYTVGGKTYKLDSEDGKYYEYNTSEGTFVETNGNRNAGIYRPIYSNNGAKTNGSVIGVNNSEGVIVKKIWRDTKGNLVSPPSETGSPNGKMKVEFQVFGTLKGKSVRLNLGTTDNTLSSSTTAANNYQTKLPDPVGIILPEDAGDEYQSLIEYAENKTYNLSEFSSFEIREVLTDAQKTALKNEDYLDGYKTSGSVSDGFGSLEILNTKKANETTVDVSVEKKWVGTALDSVDVRLIQTTNTIENADLAKITASQYTTIRNGLDSIVLEKNKEYLWDLSEIILDSDNTVSVTVVPENFVTAVMDSSNPKKLKITSSTNEGSGTVRVTIGEGEDAVRKILSIAVLTPTATLNASNNWSKTWSGLPAKDENEAEYHYYVVETATDAILSDYFVSYDVKALSTT